MACLDTGQTFPHTLLHPLDGDIAPHACIYRRCSINATAQPLEPACWISPGLGGLGAALTIRSGRTLHSKVAPSVHMLGVLLES